MSARDFLDYLESQGLLDEAVLRDLRRQVKESRSPVTAEAIAKLLVESGHLTKFQATKLVGQIAGPDAGRRTGGPKETSREGRSRQAEEELTLVDDELAPLEELEELGDRMDGSLDDGAQLEEIEPLEDLTELTRPNSNSQSGGAPSLDHLDEHLSDGPDMGVEAMGQAPSQAVLMLKKKLQRKDAWNSPYLVGGGGLLVVLVVGSLVLWMSLTRGTADDIYNAALEDYRSQDYANSIKKFERFLRSYAHYPKGVNAVVYTSMAKLRQAVEQSSDPTRALEKAREELPKIVAEENLTSENGQQAVDEARVELSTLLPVIVDEFAQEAKKANNVADARRWLDGAESAMQELIQNTSYFPSSAQRSQRDRLAGIVETMGLVQRRINMEEKLKESLAGIEQATVSGQTAQAYQIRKELLQEYREFEGDQRLVSAMKSVTQRQQDLVTKEALTISPSQEEAVAGARLHVVLANVTGAGISVSQTRVLPYLLNGAVYGVDAAKGQVLWRRYVGRKTESLPASLTDQPNADILVIDGERHQLMRVKALTGELMWRVALDGAFAQPVVAGDRVAIAGQDGRLFELDAETGTAQEAARIPQPLRVGPGVGPRRPQLYQIADHDNLYVVSRDSMECKEVYYVGHKSGSIVIPPQLVLGRLLLFENAGPRSALLHVVSTNTSGLELTEAQPPISLDGHVLTEPVIDGRRVYVPTSLGAIYVFDVDPRNQEGGVPVTPAVEPRVATREQHLLSFAVVDRTKLWVGDDRLSRYEVQTAQNRLNRLWAETPGNYFVASIHRFTNALIQARSPANAPGVTLAATDEEDTKKTPFWKAEVGAPLARLLVDGGRITALSTRGAIYEINRDALRDGFAKPTQPGIDNYFRYAVRLADGRTALISRDKQLLVFSPSDGQRVSLKLANAGVLTSEPLAFGSGLLATFSGGEVAVIDVNSGAAQMLPFQPAMSAGQQINWRRPALVDEASGRFLLSDGAQTIYVVGASQTGQPHLEVLHQVTIEERVVSPLAVSGATCYAVFRPQAGPAAESARPPEGDTPSVAGADAGDRLVALSVDQLAEQASLALRGRVLLGPLSVADVVLVETDDEGLMCFDGGQQPRWTYKPNHALAGQPWLEGDELILALVDGAVVKVRLSDGGLTGSAAVGEPLLGGPVVFSGRVLVSGDDGTVHVLDQFQ